MRALFAILLCLPLIAPPGACLCGASVVAPSAGSPHARSCRCCQAAAADGTAAAAELAASSDGQPCTHAPGCPSHRTSGTRLVLRPGGTWDAPFDLLPAPTPLPGGPRPVSAVVDGTPVIPFPSPPLYLLSHDFRC